jgi:phosphopentomutase
VFLSSAAIHLFIATTVVGNAAGVFARAAGRQSLAYQPSTRTLIARIFPDRAI